ncbi:MAG: 50S ribosomal protein L10 [Saprospiraceae bacterium]|nr:50S ribosomal protein L10 [Saprospiraceae bacterium]
MDKAGKTAQIAELKEKFENTSFFYIADSSSLSVAKINTLRRKCFDKGIEIRVIKNTLVKKALSSIEGRDYESIYESLNGASTFFFTAANPSEPAKIIEEFRKTNDKPLLKAAYIDTAVFIGDDQLEKLAKLKSKEELVGEVIGLLQSPAKNVISALKSGGQTIAGLVKALEERAA